MKHFNFKSCRSWAFSCDTVCHFITTKVVCKRHKQPSTYWWPCNNSVRPLRPPMSHMMTLWSAAPEKSSLWTGSHHRAATLPGGDKRRLVFILSSCRSLRRTPRWSGVLAPPSAYWTYCREIQQNQSICSKAQTIILPLILTFKTMQLQKNLKNKQRTLDCWNYTNTNRLKLHDILHRSLWLHIHMTG